MKYRVVVRVLEECVYEVEANDPKDAEYKSVHAEPVSTEELQAETMSISPVTVSGESAT